MPKISVIIPIYNVEKYLRQCLDSIINQTLEDIEIICIDDGSTDASINILKEYASNDKRLKYMTQKNQYAGVARNNGIKEATSEYLLFLDSDDFFDITLCEKTYQKAIEKNADIVLFGGKRFDQRINEYLTSPWYFKTEMLPQNNPFSRIDMDGRLLELTFLGPWNKLFKKSFIQNNHIQFQPLHNSNDDYFVAVALSLANRITYVDEELVYHRIGLQNNLQSKKYQHPLCFMDAYEAIYDRLNQEGIYNDVKQGFISRLLTDCVYHFKTMKDSHAKWLICQNIKEEHFNRMGILEAETKGNSIKNQKYIEGILNAYQWHENMCCIDGYEYRIISQSKIEHPKISIIIYLSSINHCINNILNQKQNDIELNIITNFINHIKIDDNITVIEQNNDNLSYARNIGLDFSKGEYILFLDENNHVILNELEKIYQYAYSHKLEVLYFNQYNQSDIMNGKDYFKYLVNNELLIPNIQYTLFNAYYMKKMKLKFSFDVHIDQYLSYRNLVFADKVSCISYNIYQINILNNEQSYQSFYDYFISAYHINKNNDSIDRKEIYCSQLIKKAKKIYFNLSLEHQLITESLDSLEYNYFMLCINDEFKLYEKLQRAYDEKSLINQKLQQTYDEKSLINKKLQITYKEKHERGIKIKELEAENIKLQDEIEDMKNSMIWKIGSILTKPFKKG